jgi:hypothetical protein
MLLTTLRAPSLQLRPTGGVTSFSGDGVVLSNSDSTGAVTDTLESIAANLVLAGPSSGSSHTPIFRTLTVADIPSLPLNVIANPTALVSFAFAAYGFNRTYTSIGSSTCNEQIGNPTATTSGANQNSPQLSIYGKQVHKGQPSIFLHQR